jgi:hypothetical protein
MVASNGLESRKEKYISLEERCDQLIEFKDEFEHCNVPHKCPALGSWCSKTRIAYNKIRYRKENN